MPDRKNDFGAAKFARLEAVQFPVKLLAVQEVRADDLDAEPVLRHPTVDRSAQADDGLLVLKCTRAVVFKHGNQLNQGDLSAASPYFPRDKVRQAMDYWKLSL